MRRKYEVQRLRLDKMTITAAAYTFLITEPCKNYSDNYNLCQEFKVLRFPRHPEKCPYTALYWYLRQRLRKSKVLFITTTTFTPAHPNTLSRWVQKTMQQAGIDTNIFKPHSTRSAASSAAFAKFIPIDQILSLGKWRSFFQILLSTT